jgi:hypothetical protein
LDSGVGVDSQHASTDSRCASSPKCEEVEGGSMREAAKLGAQYELAVCTDLLRQDVGIWLRIHRDFATSA